MIFPLQQRKTLVLWLHYGLLLFLYVLSHLCSFFLLLIHISNERLFPGLLHGHSDLVCNFLYNIWRYIWCIPPSGRGWWIFPCHNLLYFHMNKLPLVLACLSEVVSVEIMKTAKEPNISSILAGYYSCL